MTSLSRCGLLLLTACCLAAVGADDNATDDASSGSSSLKPPSLSEQQPRVGDTATSALASELWLLVEDASRQAIEPHHASVLARQDQIIADISAERQDVANMSSQMRQRTADITEELERQAAELSTEHEKGMSEVSSQLEQIGSSISTQLQSHSSDVVDQASALSSLLEQETAKISLQLGEDLEKSSFAITALLASQISRLTAQLESYQSQLSTHLELSRALNANLLIQISELSAKQDQLSSQFETTGTQQLEGLESFISTSNETIATLTSRKARKISAMSADDLSSKIEILEDTTRYRDCSDVPAGLGSGVYYLDQDRPVPVLCDLNADSGSGWTVIQKRADIKPRLDFYLPWASYKQGFGSLHGEFWWGLDNIWRLTSAPGRKYQLRVDLEDWDGTRGHAVYQLFQIASEADKYRLKISGYSGNATDGLTYHNDMLFSTKDQDNDNSSGRHCAVKYGGAWWYKSCYAANLNGKPLEGRTSRSDGIAWNTWKDDTYSFKDIQVKIRPAT